MFCLGIQALRTYTLGRLSLLWAWRTWGLKLQKSARQNANQESYKENGHDENVPLRQILKSASTRVLPKFDKIWQILLKYFFSIQASYFPIWVYDTFANYNLNSFLYNFQNEQWLTGDDLFHF